MGIITKAMACGVLVVAGLFAVSVAMRPSKATVSSNCRSVVGAAAINVDAWRSIRAACTEQEQQTLLHEFRDRGISTAQIERSRAAN